MVAITEEAMLPPNLQRGLLALRERMLPEARVLTQDGNFAIISVGTMTRVQGRTRRDVLAEAHLPEIYTAELARLFARVSLNFPDAQPYGVITVPFLTRKDARPIEWEHLNNANAQSAAQALGVTDLGFWSWGWQDMPQREPEDLVSIVEWARKCIREGAK
jgi:hypothetical protein